MDLFGCMSAFVQVVEQRSFQKAAENKNISPSYISKQVSWLEGHLGVKLLQRTTRRLSLTELGAVYYEQCVDILKGIEKSEDLVTKLQGEVQGELKVVAPLSFGISHLSMAVSEFNKRYPKVSINMHLSDGREDIIERGFDLGIRIAMSLSDSSLIVRELSKGFQVRAVASHDYLEKHGIPKQPSELSNHNCLIYTNFKSHSYLWTFNGPNGEETVNVDGSIKTNSTLFLRQCILDGVGIGMMGSYTYIQDFERQKIKFLFDGYTPVRPKIFALYPSRDYLPQKTSAFISFLKEWFALNLDA